MNNKMQHQLKSIIGVLLMGGQGSRMGYINKSLLTLGETTFLDISLEALSIFDTTVISAKDTNTSLPSAYPVIYDMVDAGPLGALYTVLSHYDGGIFAISCDMPYIDKEIIQYILSLTEYGYDAVIPTIHGSLQPLCGWYTKNVLPAFKESIGQNNFSIKNALKNCSVKHIELVGTKQEKKLFNVNQPFDYNQLK